jgi:hypothetical protein
MIATFLMAALFPFQAPGVDEPTAAAALDAAVKSISGYNLSKEPKLIGDDLFLRRLLKDVLGADPTLAELEAFVNDSDPRKRSVAIARAVEDDRFAPFWAGRFAEVYFGEPQKLRFTLIEDRPAGIELKVVKQFTEWLAGKIRKDVPWNEISSDLIDARGTTDGQPALAYLLAGYQGHGFQVEFPARLARHFLGIRLGCARCHDHPYDRWTVENFYALGAFATRQKVRRVSDALEVTYAAEGDLRMPSFDFGKASPVSPAKGGLAQPNFLFGGTVAEGEDRMHALAGWVTARKNPQFTRAWVNRVWGWLLGYGILNPVDDFNLRNKALSPALLETLVRDAQEQSHSLKRLIRVICKTAAYQMPGPDQVPEGSTFRHLAKFQVERSPYYPLARNAPPPPVGFEVPPEWTRVAPRNGARATYLIPDPSNKSRTAELGLFMSKLGQDTLDPRRTQFEGGNPGVKTEVLEGKIPVTWTEFSGTYTCDRLRGGPMDYLIWLAAFEAADGKTYTFRLQGSADLVRLSRAPFLELLKSLGK